MTEGEYHDPWIELPIGNSSLMIFRLEDPPVTRTPVHVPWVYVEDFDAHLAHAEDKGVKVLARNEWSWFHLRHRGLEGNLWTFAQARPTQLRD